jgi:hypothetical protein
MEATSLTTRKKDSRATPSVTDARIAGPENADVVEDSELKKSLTQLASRRLERVS